VVPFETFHDAKFHRRQERLRDRMGNKHYVGTFQTQQGLHRLLLDALRKLPEKPDPKPPGTPGPPVPTPPPVRPRRTRWYVAAAAAAAVALAVVTTVLLVPGRSDPGCPVPTELVLSTSADTADVLRDLAGEFIKSTRVGPCRQANIHVVTASPDSLTTKAFADRWPDKDLRAVGPYPHVWVPSSRLEVDRAEAALRSSGNAITFTRLPSVMSSYLVVAAPDGLVREPGWSNPVALSLAQVTNQAETTDSLRILRDGPEASTEGLVSTAALYRAKLGRRFDPESLTGGEVGSELHKVEQATVTSGGIEQPGLALGCRAAVSTGPPFEVALMSEQRVFAHNTENPLGKSCGKPQGLLTAFYPTDGVPLLDYPFVIIGGALWGNDARAAVARNFHSFLQRKDVQDDLARHGFRPPGGAPFDPIAPGPGIRRESPGSVFRPDPDSVDVKSVVAAWKSARRPARVLFALDVSGSMVVQGADGDVPLDAARGAIVPALRLVSGTDEIGLWAFSTHLGTGGQDHRELVGLKPARDGAGTHRDDVRRALAGVQGEAGDTGLFDTIRDGVGVLRADGAAKTTNALVVFTDARNDDPGGIDAESLAGELNRPGAPPVRVTLLAFGDGNCGRDDLRPLLSAGVKCLEVTSTGVGTALERVGSGLWGVP
jgi:Ca-activated chloride channel family protein